VEAESSVSNQSKTQRWIVSVTSLGFIVLQSACTAIMAISGVRLVIGLGALAAASGVNGVAGGFHRDSIRIPMMTVALLGSTLNLYMIWRVRSLRGRPSAQWRAVAATRQQLRSERIQIGLALATLVLVLAEWISHHFIFRGGTHGPR